MTPTKKRDVVKFVPNVPVEVALKFALPGKMIATPSGERMMYTLADNRVMFLDLGTAKKIEELGVNVREPFFIRRLVDAKKAEEWNVWLPSEKARAPKVTIETPVEEETPLERQLRESIEMVKQGKIGELGNGAFAVPSGASVVAPAPAQADAQNGHHALNNGNGTTNGTNGKNGTRHSDPEEAWTQYLLGQTDALVDVYAAALSNASTKHGNQVKPEDVRSLLVTVFIQRSKVGAYGA